MIGLAKQLRELDAQQLDIAGNAINGRAVTATLRVSPNGDNTNGSSWAKAYTTIQAALDAASVDAEDNTLIIVGPTATFYDIDTTGDPTWAGNYEIVGSHRIWAAIRNEHATATSVFKFTGKASIRDLAIFTEDTVDGVIFTMSGWRVRQCGFNSSGTSGPNTSVCLDGSAALTRGGIMEDVQFIGHVTHTKAIHINTSTVNEFDNVQIHTCLTAFHVVGATSDLNTLKNSIIGDCALGIDIDSGNEQHFIDVTFHGNTRNVDDEVGDSVWVNPSGAFDIEILPNNLVGTNVPTGGAGAYGADTELLSAVSRDNPFRIVGVNFVPDALPAELYQVRFSDDAGTSFYDVLQFLGDKREAGAAPSGTENIFNAGTRISASARTVSGGDNVLVWLEVQEV